MNLLLRFKEYIRQENLFSQKDKLLVAVSGGVDSVVLCELCKQAAYDFIIVHCNFQLRGEESERDEIFVRSLAKKYAVEILVKKFKTEQYAEEKKLSIQEAARELRYDWFEELVRSQESGALPAGRQGGNKNSEIKAHLLTAHHADDSIETLLMNFCRGTGLNGLTGIPVISSIANLRRPLLAFWKEELLVFATENKLDFVEDSSNQSLKYTRNLFRREIIPLIAKAYPQVKQNLNDNISRFKEIKQLYQLTVSDFKKKFLRQKNNETYIPVKQLMAQKSRALVFEIINDFGFTEKQVDEVIKLSESESGKFIQSPLTSYRIIKFGNWLIVSSDKPSQSETIIIEEGVESLETGMGNLKIEKLAGSELKISSPPDIACLDANEILFPLILRRWKQGDYFYPLGMKKKKKLSRFFIDQKFSKTQKENAWIIEMNKKIVWVVGHRIDDRFKITDKTNTVMKISLVSPQI
ncbi:MAG: tRNA lysidine(34) synthetase TilS [Bacteroidota bacterium]